MDSAAVGRDSGPPPARRRRTLRRIGLGALGICLVLGALAGALIWQATRGSVSLEPLRSRIEIAIAERLPAEATVAIGSAAFAYRRGEGVVVRARGVELNFPGTASISVEELRIATTVSAIARRRVDLSRVAASGVDIGLSVVPAASWNGSIAARLRQATEALAAQAAGADGTLRRAGLDEVVVRDAAVSVADAAGGGSPALQIAEASWRPVDDRSSELLLRVVEESGREWKVTAGRSADADGNAFGVGVAGLPVAALAPEITDSDGGPTFRSALAVRARIVTGQDGALTTLAGSLSAGQGMLSLTPADRIDIAGASLDFALDATGDNLVVTDGEFRTNRGSVAFEGAVDLSEADGAMLVGDVRGGKLPAAADDAVELTGGEFLARLDLSDRGIRIERLHLTTADGSVSAIGQASLGGSTPGLSLALSLSEMPVRVARAFWPPFVASKTRRWFDENVKSGTFGPATLRIALPPEFIGRRRQGRVLPDYALLGSIPFKDAAFSPLSTLPVVRGAAGEIAFADATATLRADSGVMFIPQKGALRAGGTALTVPELGRPQLRGNLHLALSGPAAALAALSDMPPLSVAAKRGVRADDLSGDAELALEATTPLFPSPLDAVKPRFRLALVDFTSTSPIAGRQIGDADLVLEGGPERFTVTGAGRLDGIEASVDLVLGSEAEDWTDVQLSLDDEARERLGLSLGGLVTGPIGASIYAAETGGQTIALDLEQARIKLPFLGWEKGPGVAANASFLMEKSEEGTRISELSLSGAGFAATGGISIGPDGKLRELRLTELALRPGDSVSVTAIAEGEGYDVQVSGRALDARGIIRGLRGGLGGSGLDAGPVRIALDIGAVTGQGGTVLSEVAGSLSFGAGGLQTASLTGRSEGDRPFEWTLGRERDVRSLRLSAEDGGALMRFAGIYGKVSGGRLVLDYSGAAGGSGQGNLHLRDFRVVDEAALAPAVRSARPGVREAGLADLEEPASRDLNFSELRVPFRQADWVISVDDAALRGPMLGATASGTVNVKGGRVAISGTFIPAFGINNMAGAIPLIGTILGGGRDEGLVGITYKLFGPLDDPELTMNPISAIAPGIFRKIFEYN